MRMSPRMWLTAASLVLSLVTTTAITDIELERVLVAEAVKGSVAKLPCDVHTDVPEDRAHLVIWYKDLTDSPIYSYDARDRNADVALHWVNNTLRGRATFRFSDKPAKLTIEAARDSDGGVYRCRVDFMRSPTRHYQVNLTIIGRPLPRVTWWQENALLDDTFEAISERRVRNVLLLERLERRHLHAVYTCLASNNNYVAPISSAVTLDLNLRPLHVSLVGDNPAMSANQSYELSCRVVGSRPPPVITWWKGSVALRSSRETTTSDGNVTVSTLRFTPTMEDSGKFLSCRAETHLIPDSALEDGWKIIVYHTPVVTLELSSNANISGIKEGMDVFFECNVKSNPWIYRVNWLHNGEPMKNIPTLGIMVSNQSLVLQDVTRERSGDFRCIATNQEGDGQSNTVYLQIKFAPVCKERGPVVVGVARQEEVRVMCEVEAQPAPTSYRWAMNNSVSEVDLPGPVDSAGVLTLRPTSELDYGTLWCTATNEVGEQRTPCVIHLIPAGKPGGLTNCTLTNQTTGSVQVECLSGVDGGLPQAFVMEMYDSSSRVLVSNVTSRVPWFRVTGLGPGLTFHVVLYSTNSKGRSDVTVITVHTESRLEGLHLHLVTSPMLQHLTPLAAAALAGLALITILVSAVVFAHRLRRPTDKKPTNSTKHFSESSDSIEKNPDIIPQNNDLQDIRVGESESNFLHDTVGYDNQQNYNIELGLVLVQPQTVTRF